MNITSDLIKDNIFITWTAVAYQHFTEYDRLKSDNDKASFVYSVCMREMAEIELVSESELAEIKEFISANESVETEVKQYCKSLCVLQNA